MINQTKDYYISEKKDSSATNINRGKNNTDSSVSSTAKVVWRSPNSSDYFRWALFMYCQITMKNIPSHVWGDGDNKQS
jgi:hypothetical protein